MLNLKLKDPNSLDNKTIYRLGMIWVSTRTAFYLYLIVTFSFLMIFSFAFFFAYFALNLVLMFAALSGIAFFKEVRASVCGLEQTFMDKEENVNVKETNGFLGYV